VTSSPHVLVTGAAGAIGAAFSRAYRARHAAARFSLIDVNLEGALRVAEALGGDANAASWDLSAPDALPDHVAALVESRGEIDVLVNCAGIMDVRSLSAMPWAQGARLLRVDLESPLRLMSLVVPAMQRRRRGTVVNVASMAGVTPIRGCTFYGAAKAGLAMASEIARRELEADGIVVVTVYPGPVRSDLERRARAQLPATLLTRWLPTGEAEPLAARMVEACEKRRPRVVYPSFYDLASRFPTVAAMVTGSLSPMPSDA
jgi:short-subunit dehydrogenase